MLVSKGLGAAYKESMAHLRRDLQAMRRGSLCEEEGRRRWRGRTMLGFELKELTALESGLQN